MQLAGALRRHALGQSLFKAKQGGAVVKTELEKLMGQRICSLLHWVHLGWVLDPAASQILVCWGAPPLRHTHPTPLQHPPYEPRPGACSKHAAGAGVTLCRFFCTPDPEGLL